MMPSIDFSVGSKNSQSYGTTIDELGLSRKELATTLGDLTPLYKISRVNYEKLWIFNGAGFSIASRIIINKFLTTKGF